MGDNIPAGQEVNAGCDGDGRIGLPGVICILQKIAGTRVQ